MFDQKVITPSQLPVTDRNRKCTDVFCGIIGTIFFATMLISAWCHWNKVLGYTSIIALGLGLLWLALSFLLPRVVPMIAHVLGAIVLTTFGILVLVLGDSFWGANLALKIIFAIICFILAIILIAMLCFYSNQRKFQGYMLEYGTKFFNERPIVVFYLPIFILLAIGFISLIIYQHSSFSSHYASSNNFFNLTSGIWGLLNILQLIWGLSFLRDAFHFCVSGAAVDWYWMRPHNSSCYAPYQRMIGKHFGSIVGGSFLNAFLTIPRLISELLVCHPQTCCSGLGTTCYNSCSWFSCLFDLVRHDAYSYINISGIPFCNSARQAKKINQRIPSYIGSHSPMDHYRVAAHAFLVPLALLAGWLLLRNRVINPTFWHWFILAFVTTIIVSWFINLLADAAQGLQTSYLSQRQLQNGNYNYIQKLLPSYKTPLEHLQKRMHGQGDGFL